MPAHRLSWFALALLLGSAWAGACGAAVQINEILADPASDWDQDGTVDYKSDEWIELVNLGPDPVDLADYWLKDEAADSPRMHLSGLIEPGLTAVFFGSDAVAWQAEVGVPTAGFSLNNDGDTVYLLHSFEGDGGLDLETVESITYEDHTADDDRSTGWDQERTGWILYDGLYPYTGTLDPPGTGCSPTCGEPNYCSALVPEQEVSFGALKALFL